MAYSSAIGAMCDSQATPHAGCPAAQAALAAAARPEMLQRSFLRLALDEYGDQWSSCMRSGRVRRRARPLEKIWARVFREAGCRVQENVMLRDMGIGGIRVDDGRQLEGWPPALRLPTVSHWR